jgi:parafibromin
LVTLANVEEFLKNSKYVDGSQCAKTFEKVELSRPVGKAGEIKIRFVDNTQSFRDRDWDNVIAVFIQGAEWQFKGWKWTNPATLFSHVKAFFVHYDDEAIPTNVAKWNVTRLPVRTSSNFVDNI